MTDKLTLSVFNEEYVSPEDALRLAQHSEMLKNNPAFREAVNSMYRSLTVQEDITLGRTDIDDRHINQRIKHFAMMRCLLSDFVATLDYFMAEAESE